MLIGALADIHGNYPALEAVLSDMPVVDHVVCAGDIVGYNPWPGECVDILRDLNMTTIQGNHDRATVAGTAFTFNHAASAGVRFARDHLSDDQLQWLATLPSSITVKSGRISLAHGHPDNPDRYTYPSAFRESMLGDEEVLFLGHTHVQGFETFDTGIICNPGSVGQPRDGDPRAAYTIVDLDTATVDERRVGYPIDEVSDRIRDVGLPVSLAERLYAGR